MTPRPPQSKEHPRPPVSISAGIINTLFLSGEADGYNRDGVRQQLIEQFKDYEAEVAHSAIRDFGEKVKALLRSISNPERQYPPRCLCEKDIDRLMEENHA